MKNSSILQSKTKLTACQLLLLVVIFFFWWLMTKPGLIPPFVFEDDNQAAFFFGEPVQICQVIWDWFFVNLEIYPNLAVTLTETVLAFVFGTVAGLIVGLWLALAPTAAAILDPYIKGLNCRVLFWLLFSAFGSAWESVLKLLWVSPLYSLSFSSTFIRAFVKSARMFWPVPECLVPTRANSCAMFICRVLPAGYSPLSTLPWVWLSSVR